MNLLFFSYKNLLCRKRYRSDIFQYNFEYPPNSRFICQTFSYSIPTGTQSFREKIGEINFSYQSVGFERSTVVCQTQYKETISAKLSGFKCSSFRPRLGQETLLWRSIRGGEETVLKNFPDNTVLTVCHFSFYFPFCFSRPDIESFFFLDQIFHSILFHFWLWLRAAVISYCRNLWPVFLYTISVCVCVCACAGVLM